MIKPNSYGSSVIVGLIVFTLILSCVPNVKLHDNVNPTTLTQEISYPSITCFVPLTLTEHRITASELVTIKKSWGTYQENAHYNHTTNGHGAGVKPPTAEEWTEIAQNAYVVDNISYANTASSVDNSKLQYFPPIGNQGSQSSCVAWSIGYYMATYLAAKQHGWNLTGATMNGMQVATNYQSNVMSPAFVYNLINSGEDGGASFYDAIKLVCGVGASSWKNMPYNQADYSSWPSQIAWTEAPQYRGNSNGYQYMSLNSDQGITNLKYLLASGNLASINVDSDKFSVFTANDIWTFDNYISSQPLHAGTVVGYDDNFTYNESGRPMQGAFKIANSWGIGFYGEKIPDGYYWISYEAMKQRINWCCYFFEQPNYQPDLLATFNVNDQARGACTVTVGLGTPSNPIATKCFNDYVSGGSKPYPSNNIVLDVSEFKSYLPALISQPFFLQCYENGNQIGSVNYFAIGNETASGVPSSIPKYPTSAYLNITYNKINSAITVSPTTGPAGTKVAISGLGFTPNNYLSISYLNPVTSNWVQLNNNVPVNATSHFSYQFPAPDIAQNIRVGDNPATYCNLIFQARDNNNGYICNASMPFMEVQRGLTQVGIAVANGLYGNNTNLTSTVTFRANQLFIISGIGFYPGNISILSDGTQNIGTSLVDDNGFFNLTATMPGTLSDGQHNIVLVDKNAQFLVTINVATPPLPTPTPSLLPPTETPSPTLSPTPTPTTTQSLIASPTPAQTTTPIQSTNPTTAPTQAPTNQPTPSATADSTTNPNQNTQSTTIPHIPELNTQTIIISLTILAISCLAIKISLRKDRRYCLYHGALHNSFNLFEVKSYD
jgi:C1A family cysteine protease